MNIVDLIIVLLIASAIAHGLRQGAAVQLLGFGGFWGGLFLGATIAPFVSGLFVDNFAKIVASLSVILGLASIADGVGRQVGVHIWGRLKRTRLGFIDTSFGAFIAVAATLFALWLIATMLATLPFRGIAKGINESRIIRGVDSVMPPAPSVFAQIRRILSAADFPDVFAGVEPSAEGDVALPDDPAVRAIAQSDRVSTLKVTGVGCGGVSDGSGFIVADGLVATNAHVIAGITNISVQDQRGSKRATPVFFDSDYDLAFLRVENLRGHIIELADRVAPRGTGTAVLGYPGGGPFTAVPGAVLSDFRAVGRDIYGRRLVERRVYQIRADVRPGNSGGPFLDRPGSALGVVFASSGTQEEIGYVLISSEVERHLEVARGRTARVDTGECIG